MQLLHHPLEPVEAAAVGAQLLGGEEVGTDDRQEHAPDAPGDQVGHLLLDDRLAGHPEVAQEHQERTGAQEDPPDPGAQGRRDPPVDPPEPVGVGGAAGDVADRGGAAAGGGAATAPCFT